MRPELGQRKESRTTVRRWNLDAHAAVPGTATVVFVGSGLITVGAAIALLDAAPRCRVVMVGRHGEPPRAHPRSPEPSARVACTPDGRLLDGAVAVAGGPQRRSCLREVI